MDGGETSRMPLVRQSQTVSVVKLAEAKWKGAGVREQNNSTRFRVEVEPKGGILRERPGQILIS